MRLAGQGSRVLRRDGIGPNSIRRIFDRDLPVERARERHIWSPHTRSPGGMHWLGGRNGRDEHNGSPAFLLEELAGALVVLSFRERHQSKHKDTSHKENKVAYKMTGRWRDEEQNDRPSGDSRWLQQSGWPQW